MKIKSVFKIFLVVFMMLFIFHESYASDLNLTLKCLEDDSSELLCSKKDYKKNKKKKKDKKKKEEEEKDSNNDGGYYHDSDDDDDTFISIFFGFWQPYPPPPPQPYGYPSPRRYRRKDPGLAAFYSFVVPGMGQFYAGQPERGLAFFMGEMTLFISAMYCLDNYTYYDDFAESYYFAYDDRREEYMTDQEALSLKRHYRRWFNFLWTFEIAAHLFDCYDAYHQTKRYNRKYKKYFSMKMDEKTGTPMLALNLNF